MSMIREVIELSSIQPNAIEKIKVSSAEILIHGTKGKPYYEIKYRDLSDGQIHEGYGSYNLDYVFEWLEECFEIIPEKDADRMSISEQINELRELAGGSPNYWKVLDEAADTIEALSAKLQAANMERSAEDCGRWITDRVPTKEECGDSFLGKEFAVTVDANGIKTLAMDFIYETVRGKEVSRWKWMGRISPWKVIAWRELPEPYHEP